MRQKTIVLGGFLLSGAGLGVGLVAQAATFTARPQAVVVAASAPSAPRRIDEKDRRDQLNLRVQAMLREGRGARLSEGPPRSSDAVGRRTPPASRGARSEGRSTTARPLSGPAVFTVPPPVARTSARPGGGYRPPTLDLFTPVNVPSDPVECLTQAIYYEARSEGEDGQAAVAEVVMNRSRSPSYPQDICKVVYQRNSRTCQFTFTCDGSIGRGRVNLAAWAQAEQIARRVYASGGRSLLPAHSVNYHADYVRPTWSRRLERVRQIGAHVFYGVPVDGGLTPGARVGGEPESTRSGLQFVRLEALDRAFAQLNQVAPERQ